MTPDPHPSLAVYAPAIECPPDPPIPDQDQDIITGFQRDALDLDGLAGEGVGPPIPVAGQIPPMRSKAFCRMPAPVPNVLTTQLLPSFRTVLSLSMYSDTPRNTSS